MRRCKSWRFHDVGHSGHMPGGRCRKCWTPCHARISKTRWQDGVRRCDRCVHSLLYAPDPQVRRALAKEPRQSRTVLEVLIDDPDGSVAFAAEQALSRLTGKGPDLSSSEDDADAYWHSSERKTKPRTTRLVTKTGSERNVW